MKKASVLNSLSNAVRTLDMVRRKGLEPPTYWFVVVRFPYHIFS